MNSLKILDVDDHDLRMYIATPGAGNHPGVLMLHAWWGFNDCFRDLCDRLAREGFIVVAPDLYEGEIASTIQTADAMSSALDTSRVIDDVSAAFDFTRQHENVAGGLGVVGISMGVEYAFWVVQSRANDVDAAVLFYGNGAGNFEEISTTFLGHFAEHDEFNSPRHIRALRERLQAGDGSVTFHTYPDTEHWFMESDRAEYDEKAASLAWSRTVEFLRTEL
ncbi:dienelactone hydrolase family protein (plasmid) [Salinigranum rubrum]|uniref:Dienelactone hydrolase family protein n=1 Tax=Salinigranum rubrum TaxID=755307 RepID=A0A2I8VQS1_9EURY|nr:dienelactone hydrolase family protein [Salinigranum rubrum]AUV84246.1 dienelactone hydrolase family protein [Salinigranum rubrum]